MKLKLVAICALAVALASAGPAFAVSPTAKVKLRKTSIGKILTNGSGFTLYMFTRDKKNSDSCVHIASCTSIWPPLTTGAKPLAGPGVKASLLGRIKLQNGKSQVTYAGHPLYTYSADAFPGEVDYVGFPMFGGNWDALSASGKAIK